MYEPMRIQNDFVQRTGLGTKESTGVLENPSMMPSGCNPPHFPALMPPSPAKPVGMLPGTPSALTASTPSVSTAMSTPVASVAGTPPPKATASASPPPMPRARPAAAADPGVPAAAAPAPLVPQQPEMSPRLAAGPATPGPGGPDADCSLEAPLVWPSVCGRNLGKSSALAHMEWPAKDLRFQL